MWKFLDSGKKGAKENMQLDATLLKQMRPDDFPLLHFYDWEKKSATFGYFINPAHFLQLENVKKMGIALARRPTGGGILFHHCDLAFSILLPANALHFSLNPLHNYHFINEQVKKAVKNILASLYPMHEPSLLKEEEKPFDWGCRHFCMAKPTKYDVMIGGRKIAGAAQRNQKQGLLHQGSIAVALPKKKFLEEILLPNTKVAEGMHLHSFSLLGEDWTEAELEEMREEIKKELKKGFLEN
ncbi:MAG: lipoate--protein ligase family protein [Simkania negevensis]|nr:lipoate--protein ligase family protein [Simkania negevensis]